MVLDPSGMLRGMRLLGRRRELEALDHLLVSARAGHGAVLVVHGEPGVGKTALLDDLAEASGFRLLRTAGAEGEQDFAYAGLQQFCAPLFAQIDRLPPPQRDALGVAFGSGTGPAPNPFHVGLAVDGLLSSSAQELPILGLVDDAQWLDRPSALALAFVARRLTAKRIAIVFATREMGDTLERLPELHVEALGHGDARALLASVLQAPLDEAVMDRLVAESRGNPLALLELPAGKTPAELAGGFGLPAGLPLHTRIEESFARRLERLPAESRRLLLVAAADGTGDPTLVWRAAGALGIPATAVDAVHAERLVELGTRLAFRHPLVRSAVYRSADPAERRDAHHALADATDPERDPDRRAWHRAEATVGPDDEVAAELERSADRARARGGFAATAAFLARASVLSSDPTVHVRRALAAAEAKHQAGAFDEALALLATAETGPLDQLQRANVDALRARIAFAANRGSEAPAQLLTAARRLQGLDPARSRELYLDALAAALFAARLAGPTNARSVARAALAAPEVSEPTAKDLLLDAVASLVIEGAAVGTPLVRQAVHAFLSSDLPVQDGLRWRWLAGRTAGFIWDYDAWDALTRQQIRVARELGALSDLPFALSTRNGVLVFAGELQEAEALVEESDSLAEATDGRLVPPYAGLVLAGFRGRADALAELRRTSIDGFLARGEGIGITLSEWAEAALQNGSGRYEAAFEAATRAVVDPRELWFSTVATVELIEAASRSGHVDRAAAAFGVLEESTRASGSPWALGVEARLRAMLSDDDTAETLYREAIERLEPTRIRLDLARSHLVYGEWLRRMGRRIDARIELRAAYELFTEFGTEAFAERARIELEATGERARKRTVDVVNELTPQEAQVARLAAEGQTNKGIAAQLFISQSTVEYHLAKAFRKLDVTSRTQLARRLR
jgi:DNA-binding CsgD family transcriptional regulator